MPTSGTIVRRLLCLCLVLAGMPALAACGSDTTAVTADAKVIELPGVSGATDFDDILYSSRLRRVLVPAGAGGLDLVDPESGEVTNIGGFETVDSAAEGRGLVFVADRAAEQIAVVDPERGRILARGPTDGPPDYVRYVSATNELWVTHPGGSPSGIEIMSVPEREDQPPKSAGFIPLEAGPEALTLQSDGRLAYTHGFDGELISIDTVAREETRRWPIGCAGAHGFPAIDEADQLVLASCNAAGEVALLNAKSGEELGHYSGGGGTSLPAYSNATGHFYIRSDPGDTLTTLKASKQGLRVVDEVTVPAAGHCLAADDLGHYWTCDSDAGTILRFSDG